MIHNEEATPSQFRQDLIDRINQRLDEEDLAWTSNVEQAEEFEKHLRALYNDIMGEMLVHFEFPESYEEEQAKMKNKVAAKIKEQMTNKSGMFLGLEGQKLMADVQKRVEEHTQGRTAWKILFHSQSRDSDQPPIGLGTELYRDFLILFKEARSL